MIRMGELQKLGFQDSYHSAFALLFCLPSFCHGFFQRLNSATSPSISFFVLFSVTVTRKQSSSSGYHLPSGMPAKYPADEADLSSSMARFCLSRRTNSLNVGCLKAAAKRGCE